MNMISKPVTSQPRKSANGILHMCSSSHMVRFNLEHRHGNIQQRHLLANLTFKKSEQS